MTEKSDSDIEEINFDEIFLYYSVKFDNIPDNYQEKFITLEITCFGETPALIDKDEVRLHSTEKESPIQTYKMINALKLSSNKYRLRTEHFPTIHGELYYEYASSHEVLGRSNRFHLDSVSSLEDFEIEETVQDVVISSIMEKANHSRRLLATIKNFNDDTGPENIKYVKILINLNDSIIEETSILKQKFHGMQLSSQEKDDEVNELNAALKSLQEKNNSLTASLNATMNHLNNGYETFNNELIYCCGYIGELKNIVTKMGKALLSVSLPCSNISSNIRVSWNDLMKATNKKSRRFEL